MMKGQLKNIHNTIWGVLRRLSLYCIFMLFCMIIWLIVGYTLWSLNQSLVAIQNKLNEPVYIEFIDNK